jgi:hypothetical protein
MTEVVAPQSATRAVTGGAIRSPLGQRQTSACDPDDGAAKKRQHTGRPSTRRRPFHIAKSLYGRGPQEPIPDSHRETGELPTLRRAN